LKSRNRAEGKNRQRTGDEITEKGKGKEKNEIENRELCQDYKAVSKLSRIV
jgi:hypothetical protein